VLQTYQVERDFRPGFVLRVDGASRQFHILAALNQGFGGDVYVTFESRRPTAGRSRGQDEMVSYRDSRCLETLNEERFGVCLGSLVGATEGHLLAIGQI
jgi:hypothetical protein